MKATKYFFFLILFLLIPGIVFAANHYVRDGATGADNGTDWTNAYTKLPSSLVRGDTYYIADGSYGSYTFDSSASGSTYIYIKKATAADHGTGTGWNSTYGDGSADFSSWVFTTGYWNIDGQVGQWAPDIPNYQAYGIKVYDANRYDNQYLIRITASNTNNVVIKHTESYFTNTPRTGTWYWGGHIVRTESGLSNVGIELQYCWLHDAENSCYNGYAQTVIFDHCVIERNGQGQVAMRFNPSEHAAAVVIKGNGVKVTMRYGYLRDWRSTGGLGFYQLNSTAYIYGNIISQTGYWSVPGEANDGDGALYAVGHDTDGASGYAYNNTFVNLTYGAAIWAYGTKWTARVAENNLFYNCTRHLSAGVVLYGNHDYNWFYNSGSQSETHGQNGSGNPFMNLNGNDYRLNVDTNAGLSLSNEYSFDALGTTRGIDGSWDRGAFEYNSGIYSTRPSSPINLTIM